MELFDNALWCALGFMLGYGSRWTVDVLADVREDVARLRDRLDGRRDDDDG